MARPSFPTAGAVLDKLKSDGTFDYFRRMCVSSVQEEVRFCQKYKGKNRGRVCVQKRGSCAVWVASKQSMDRTLKSLDGAGATLNTDVVLRLLRLASSFYIRVINVLHSSVLSL